MNTVPGSSHGDDADTLLTPEEVSRELRVRPSTLRQWRHKNRGPAYTRVERFIRYTRADLDAYIQRNRTTP